MSRFRDSFQKAMLLKNSGGRFGDGFRMLIDTYEQEAREIGATRDVSGSYINLGRLYDDWVLECERQIDVAGESMHDLDELYYPERYQRTSATERLDRAIKSRFDFIEYNRLEPGMDEYAKIMSRIRDLWRQKYKGMEHHQLNALLGADEDLTDDQIEILQEVIEAKEASGEQAIQDWVSGERRPEDLRLVGRYGSQETYVDVNNPPSYLEFLRQLENKEREKVHVPLWDLDAFRKNAATKAGQAVHDVTMHYHENYDLEEMVRRLLERKTRPDAQD